MTRAYFSLGSNLGSRGEYLALAVASLTRGDEHRTSRVYLTEPVGGVDQDDFWNMVLEITTTATPQELLVRAHDAEAAAQRTRDVHWGPRTLDVDIIWVDGITWNEPDLTIPHPRMYERSFVLAPLRELREDLVSEDALRQTVGRVTVLGTLESLY